MICEDLCSCSFIARVNRLMPYTGKMIKAMYCQHLEDGCALDHEHMILPIDQNPENPWPKAEMEALEVKEIKLTDTYKVICVRSRQANPA